MRRYAPDAVEDNVLDRLFRAAVAAPSAHNRQPWRFVVVTEASPKQRIAEAMGAKLRADRLADGDTHGDVEADVARSRSRICEAPVLVFSFVTMEDMDAYPDAKRQAAEYQMSVQSTAMATQNLLVAAHAEGLGACIMCAPLFCSDAVTQVIGAPRNWTAQSLVTLGWPGIVRPPRERLPLSAVVWQLRSE
ncbi:Coenzyme F420:L-glutamate ligase (plasmid) [Variovorax sp. PBL-E5]|nr:Coenzyme F420:L-glutamate ligase [Variovorax sp. PBL-E5]